MQQERVGAEEVGRIQEPVSAAVASRRARPAEPGADDRRVGQRGKEKCYGFRAIAELLVGWASAACAGWAQFQCRTA